MKKDKQYLNNKNATKNPKMFTLSLYRDEQGNVHAMGNHTWMLDRSNNKERWVRVDTRDFVNLINTQGILVK